MIDFSSAPVVSSISIEPVDSDEYNQSLIEELTPYHKQTFLHFIKTERNLLSKPHAYPKLCSRVVDELNKEQFKCGQYEWMNILKAWRDFVSARSGSKMLTSEDKELLKCMNNIKKATTTKSIHNSMEKLSSHCRICLASSSSTMLYLFEKRKQSSHADVSLLDKLNYCSCFTRAASVDDQLPQFVCMSCSILVENAYQLKVLCGKTEDKLQEFLQNMGQNNDQTDFEIESGDLNLNTIQTEQDEHRIPLCDIKNEAEVEVGHRSTNETESRRDLDPLEVDDANEELKVENFSVNLSEEFQCDICAAVFSNKRRVRNHMFQIHKDVAQVKAFKCSECEKCFRVKSALTTHMRTHTNERPYKCEICRKPFKTLSALSNHRMVHTESKDFKCSSCPFSTNTKPNLRIHERTHSGVQPYTCHFCQMKFRTASNANKHMRNIHEKQKPNICDRCGRSFFTRESLRKHSVTHTGIKPFNCPHPECSQAYGWYNGLKKHIRHQHVNDGVKLLSEKFYLDKVV